MEIQVTGRKMDIGASLKDHIEGRLHEGTSKYFSRSIDAQVNVSKQGHGFRVDCSLHPNKGLKMQSHAEAQDVYEAFDSAADKIEKQLRRYKRRIKNHHNSPNAIQKKAAQAYVLEPHHDDDHADDAELMDQPVIIAEHSADIPTVSVSDAVMLMDIQHLSALMFVNIKSDTMNVVYKRSDGNIGWIDAAQ